MSDPLARLHARRRLSRLLRQRLRMAAAPYAALDAETAESAGVPDRDTARTRARLRRYRIARARAELDCAVNTADASSGAAPADHPQANARAIAHLLRRAMDPNDRTGD